MVFDDIIERREGWMYSSGEASSLKIWESHLERLAGDGLMSGRFAFIHHINHHPLPDIAECLPWALWEEAVAGLDGRQMVVILDSSKEGPSWRHVSGAVNRMVADGTDPRRVILWTGGSHEPDSPINTITTMDAFCVTNPIDHCLPQEIPTHHFIMLARVPRVHRVLASVGVLRRGLDAHGHMSCGSGHYGRFSRVPFNRHAPDDLRGRFPLLLPGFRRTSREYSREEATDSMKLPVITGAFCNVIMESSHDLMGSEIPPDTCTAFMSEKSERAFLLGQVPLWICAPGQVSHARDWGFDVFDDVIDHSYDLEPDPHRRMEMSLDQLAAICERPMEHWQSYKSANIARFNRNMDRCLELRRSFHELQYRKLADCIGRMPVRG
jgi:hypothetical protein